MQDELFFAEVKGDLRRLIKRAKRLKKSREYWKEEAKGLGTLLELAIKTVMDQEKEISRLDGMRCRMAQDLWQTRNTRFTKLLTPLPLDEEPPLA